MKEANMFQLKNISDNKYYMENDNQKNISSIYKYKLQ
jgi:hypothetical protein